MSFLLANGVFELVCGTLLSSAPIHRVEADNHVEEDCQFLKKTYICAQCMYCRPVVSFVIWVFTHTYIGLGPDLLVNNVSIPKLKHMVGIR